MAQQHVALPDLQLRMGKKIAQLTKVIYHLNNKSEDHELDLQGMADTYEAEIEQLLRDAAEQINSFKNQLEQARDESNFQEALGKVQLRYEQERQACLSDFEKFKQRVADREGMMQKAASERISEANATCDQLSRRLDEATHELSTLRSMAAQEDSRLRQELDKAKEETENAIQSGNHRYNAMLTERMNVEDGLNQKLEDLKLQIADKEKEVARIAREQSSVLQSGKDELAQAAKRWEEERRALQSEMKQADTVWRDKVASAMRQAEREQEAAREARHRAGGVESDLNTLTAKLENEQERSHDLETRLVALSREAASFKAAVEAERAAHAETRGQATSHERELEQLRDALASAQAAASGDRKGFERQLTDARVALNEASAKLTAERDAHAATQAELERARQSAVARGEDASRTLEELERARALVEAERTAAVDEKAAATRRYAELAAAKQAAEEDANKRLKAVRQELADTLARSKASASDALKSLQEETAGRIAALEAQHVDTVASLRREHESATAAAAKTAESALADLESKHAEALESQKIQYGEEAQSASNSAAATLAAAQAKFAAERDELNASIRELTGRAAALESELAEARRSRDALLQQLAQDGESAQASLQELEGTVSSLRASLASSEAQLKKVVAERAAADSAGAKAAEDASAREAALRRSMREQKHEHDAERLKAAQDLKRQLHELDVEWKKRSEEKLTEALIAAEKGHQHESAQGLEALEARLREESSSQCKMLLEQHAAELSMLRSANSQELARLKAEHASALVALRDDLDRKHASEIAAKRESADAVLAQARSQADASAAAAVKDAEVAARRAEERLRSAERNGEAALAAQAAKHRAEVDSLERANQEAQARAMQSLDAEQKRAAAEQQRQNREKVALQAQVDELRVSKGSLEEARDAALKRGSELEEALARKAAELSDTVYNMRQAHDTEKAALRSSAEDRLTDARDAAAARLEELKESAAEAQQEAKARYDELKQAFAELKNAWDTRGPRDEDVERIAELEQAVYERDVRLATVEERFNELRKEMLLREDNYNNTFANGGAGKMVLAVDRATASGQEMADWMLARKSSSLAGRDRSNKGTKNGSARGAYG